MWGMTAPAYGVALGWRPEVTLDEAPEAYAIYDRREALKIVLKP